MNAESYSVTKLKCYPLVYLATPYSNYPGGLEQAWIDATKITGSLIKAGVKVFSPITHGHPAAVAAGLDHFDHDFWLAFDGAMMNKSDAICVAMMNSWERSFGIAREVRAFIEAKKPVIYLKVL